MSQTAATPITAVSALPLSDQLVRATARIECTSSKGERSSGTSFFFRVEAENNQFAPLLVTNRHVIGGQQKASVYLTTLDATGADASRQIVEFRLNDLQSFAIYHPNTEIDLAAIAFLPVIRELERQGKTIESVALRPADIVSRETLDECRALESLTMIGYPNGIWDKVNNRPVIRRASSATPLYENYNGESKFLIDCACFPGSSGSPVFLLNEGMYSTRNGTMLAGSRAALVGILYAGFLHLTRGRVREATISSMQELEAEISVPNSVRICIKAAELLTLANEVRHVASQHVAA